MLIFILLIDQKDDDDDDEDDDDDDDGKVNSAVPSFQTSDERKVSLAFESSYERILSRARSHRLNSFGQSSMRPYIFSRYQF
jgi:hypothetical protein